MGSSDVTAWAHLANSFPTLGLNDSKDLFIFCPSGSDKHLRLYVLLAFELATRETASIILQDDDRLHPALQKRPEGELSGTPAQAKQWHDRLCVLGEQTGQAIHCVGARSISFCNDLFKRIREGKGSTKLSFSDVDFSIGMPGDTLNGLTVRALSPDAVLSGTNHVFDKSEYKRFPKPDSRQDKRKEYTQAALRHQAVVLPMLAPNEDTVVWDENQIRHFVTHGSQHVAALVNRILTIR